MDHIGRCCVDDSHNGTDFQDIETERPGQSIYSRLAGYDDLNDTDRLAVDVILRQLVGIIYAWPRRSRTNVLLSRWQDIALTCDGGDCVGG